MVVAVKEIQERGVKASSRLLSPSVHLRDVGGVPLHALRPFHHLVLFSPFPYTHLFIPRRHRALLYSQISQSHGKPRTRMPPRPASIASFDSVAAAEALDLFDEKNASFRTSKLAMTGAVFGSSPRRPGVADNSPRSIPSPASRLARRATSDAYGRPSSSTSAPSTPSRLRSASAAQPQPQRPGSPDIETILAKTPRPRRALSAVFASPSRNSLPAKRSPSTLSLRSEVKGGKVNGEDDESIFSISDYGALLEEYESLSEGEGGSESDSSIDLHTPLP